MQTGEHQVDVEHDLTGNGRTWFTIGKLRKFEGLKVCKMVHFAWHAACCEPATSWLFHRQLLVLQMMCAFSGLGTLSILKAFSGLSG